MLDLELQLQNIVIWLKNIFQGIKRIYNANRNRPQELNQKECKQNQIKKDLLFILL